MSKKKCKKLDILALASYGIAFLLPLIVFVLCDYYYYTMPGSGEGPALATLVIMIAALTVSCLLILCASIILLVTVLNGKAKEGSCNKQIRLFVSLVFLLIIALLLLDIYFHLDWPIVLILNIAEYFIIHIGLFLIIFGGALVSVVGYKMFTNKKIR